MCSSDLHRPRCSSPSDMKFASPALALAAFVTSAAAQLTILSPGGPDLWWVAQSQNTVIWTCDTSPYSTFTVLIDNSDPKILTSELAIIAQQENFDCSETISQYQVTMPAASGYTLIFANPLNNTDVYAQTQPFEIKALGATYPAASATPTGGSSATVSGSSSAAASGASASSTAATSSKKNAAGRVAAPVVALAALAAAAGIAFA